MKHLQKTPQERDQLISNSDLYYDMSYSVAYSTFANIPAGNHFWIYLHLLQIAIIIGIPPSLFFIPCKHLKRYIDLDGVIMNLY